MSEEEMRTAAHHRNDLGRDPVYPGRDKWYTGKGDSVLLTDDCFRDKVASYIDSIPAKVKHCPACEGVLCGLCGKCHELDRKTFFTGVDCPIAQRLHQSDECRTWDYAYQFLKDASMQELSSQ